MPFTPITDLSKYTYKYILGKFLFSQDPNDKPALVDIQKHKGAWWVTAGWPMALHHLGEDGKWRYKVGNGFPTAEAALEAFNKSMTAGPEIV